MMWFLRMAKWARHPPSPTYVKIVLVVVGIAALFIGIEQLFGWPEWLTPNTENFRRPMIR
ncbi:MAG: hypothetical protein ACU0DW_07690 [Shimia sp.]